MMNCICSLRLISREKKKYRQVKDQTNRVWKLTLTENAILWCDSSNLESVLKLYCRSDRSTKLVVEAF